VFPDEKDIDADRAIADSLRACIEQCDEHQKTCPRRTFRLPGQDCRIQQNPSLAVGRTIAADAGCGAMGMGFRLGSLTGQIGNLPHVKGSAMGAATLLSASS
jgi:hypothetical protein